MTRRTSFVLVLAAVLPTLVGCGSGDVQEPAARSEQVKPSAASTRPRLIADARRICARMEARLTGLGRPTGPPSPKQVLAIVDAWSLTIAELHRLDPPPAEAARFRRMLKHFRAAARAARALPDAKGEAALVAAAAMADQGMRGGTIAHAYRLDACSLFPPAPTRAEFERYVREQMQKPGGMLDPATFANPPGGRLEHRMPRRTRP